MAVQCWRNQHPAAAAWLDASQEADVFAASLAGQLAAKGTLSDAQTEAIARRVERQAEQERWELEDAAGRGLRRQRGRPPSRGRSSRSESSPASSTTARRSGCWSG